MAIVRKAILLGCYCLGLFVLFYFVLENLLSDL